MIFVNSGGLIVVYFDALNHFKSEAEKRINDLIPSEQILSFEVDKQTNKKNKNFEFVGSDEIKTDDMMYDVFQITETVDKIIYYCLSDENEYMFETAFIDYLNSQSQDNFAVSHIKNILKDLVLTGIANYITFSFDITFLNFIPSNIYNSKIFHFEEIPTPPPRA